MKPWILIVSGIVLAILLILWIFLFFAGDDARADLFNALNFGDTTGEGLGLEDFFDTPGEDEAAGQQLLRQLSLRRAAGYAPYAATASSSAVVYMAEAGTGHIYTIDPITGMENRISNITIPTARHAVFSDDKTLAVVGSADNANVLTIVTLPHGSTTLDSFTIAADAFSFSFTNNNILLYAEQNNSSVEAYAYNIAKKTKTALFTLPFRDATIIWGATSGATHLAYPRTASHYEGYMYQIKSGTMSRLPISGYGLSANANAPYAVFSKRVGDLYESSIYETSSGRENPLSFAFLPDKCVLEGTHMLCGLSKQGYTTASPDTWYSGEVTYSDELWYTDLEFNTSEFVLDLETESGRQLDVINPRIQSDAAAAYFINKADQSLWIYEGDFIANSSDN